MVSTRLNLWKENFRHHRNWVCAFGSQAQNKVLSLFHLENRKLKQEQEVITIILTVHSGRPLGAESCIV